MSEHAGDPILIVGAGPTGLTAAVELARRGIEHRIVDRKPAPVEESRALAVQSRTLEVWLDQGISQEALERGIEIHSFTLHLEGADPVEVSVDDAGGPFGHPLVLPQDVTERLLVDRLEQLGSEVERPTELEELEGNPQAPSARLSSPEGSTTIQPSWIVGADGAHSTIRSQLGLAFEGVPYPDRFVVADVDLEADLEETRIHAWIQGGRLLLVVPLRRAGHFRVITTHQPADGPAVDPDEPPAPDRLQSIVDDRSTVPIELEEPRWTSVFRVHCRGVPSYRVGRVLLAGDAAHIHSPAGGQGMNTGIQDAHNLAWKLALAEQELTSAGLLDSYHDERHPVGRRLLETTDRLFQLAASSGRLARFGRRFLVRPLIGTSLAQDRLKRFVSQRGIRYRDSPVVGPDELGSGGGWRGQEDPRVGDQVPDAWVYRQGDPVRLLAALAGSTGHQILLFQGTTPQASPEAMDRTVQALERSGRPLVEDVWRIVHAQPHPGEATLVDPRGALHEAYGRGPPGYEVVRPDGHLGARSRGLDTDTLEAYLAQLTR